MSARQSHSDDGFSIVEALVVIAISATLLSVLTPMITTSQAMSTAIDDSFAEMEDQRFFELQFRGLLGGIQDPALRPNESRQSLFSRDRGEALSRGLTGEARSFDATAVTLWGGQAGLRDLTVRMIAAPDGGGTWLSAQLGEQSVVWPVRFDANVEFAYLDDEGRTHTSWPPLANTRQSLLDRRQYEARVSLPQAIAISQPGGEGEPPVLTLFPVRS